MKKYHIEFYSNNGYLLGEVTKEYNDISEVEQYLKTLMKGNSIKITSEDSEGLYSIEFLRVEHIAKVIITEQK